MEASRLSKSNLSSPVKSELYYNLEEDKKLILKRVHYLFIVYAAKASRYAFREMSEKCFMELMEDIFQFTSRPLLKNSDAWKKIATLYHGKGRKTGMVFQQFLKLLPGISCHLSRSNDPQDDLKYLMKQIVDVYKKKVSLQIENKYVQFDFNLKKDTLDYISKLADQLLIVYKLYFPQQMTSQSIYQSFDNVMLFFKEFEIYPKIISASQLYLIFLEIINSDVDNMFSWADQQRKKIGQKGSIFTFSKFIDTLVRVGIVSISRLKEVQDPQWWLIRQKQSIKALLEYMQNVKIKNKNSKFKQVRFSFILLEEYNSQAEKWNINQNDKMIDDSKGRDFFQLFERMKL